jgi:ABC-2 type transport system permease protein
MSKPAGLVDRTGMLTAEGGALAEAVIGEEFVLKKQEDRTQKNLEELPSDLESLADNSDLADFFDRRIVLLNSVDEARDKIQSEEWNGIVVIPEDYVEVGKLEVYSRKSDLLGSALNTGWLSQMLRNEILRTTSLTENEVERIRSSAQTAQFEINEQGEFEKVNWLSKGLSLGVPLAVAGLLVVALMMNASALLASIAEEKENKVMEVIVSSVSADQLLFGKVLGIVCAGLLQIAIWMAMVSVIPLLLQIAMNEFVDYNIDLLQLVISGVFMVMGFLFYGSLLAGMGSLGSTYKECQQLSAVVIICACMPLMMPTVFLADPNALVPRVLSMIPFFSPIGMTLRLSSGDVALWEVSLSFLVLVVATWVAIKLAARLFRAGTLMRGKPPGIREIWKVLVEGA